MQEMYTFLKFQFADQDVLTVLRLFQRVVHMLVGSNRLDTLVGNAVGCDVVRSEIGREAVKGGVGAGDISRRRVLAVESILLLLLLLLSPSFERRVNGSASILDLLHLLCLLSLES